MNTIWDIVLTAEKNNLSKESLFFKQATYCSPYYEQAFTLINQQEIGKNEIEINSRVRFNELFKELLHPDCKGYDSYKNYLFDVIIHYLCEIDLRHGLTKREYYIRRLTKEIINGCYGSEIARSFKEMDINHQNRLATLVLNQLQTGASLLIFRKAVKVLFDDAMIYQVKEDKQQILLYIGEKKTKKNDKAITFIKDVFLPISYKLRVFWEYHFGVIDIDVSMVIDEIEIY